MDIELAPRPVVVGVDGSPSSAAALAYAARLARALDLPLRVVGVWHYRASGFGVPPIGLVPVLLDEEPRRAVQAAVDELVETTFSGEVPEGTETVIVEGNPADVLIAESGRAEMLVVGSRGHGGFAGLLLGSVSSQCAEHGTCPVLVVHPAPEPRAARP